MPDNQIPLEAQQWPSSIPNFEGEQLAPHRIFAVTFCLGYEQNNHQYFLPAEIVNKVLDLSQEGICFIQKIKNLPQSFR